MVSTVASHFVRHYIILQLRKNFSFLITYFSFLILLSACSTSKKLTSQSQPNILSDSNLLNAHVGISIYDPSTNKYLYTHKADKYFIPASNTKLFTCYAAMKHLGDSLVGLKYSKIEGLSNKEITSFIIKPTGDPTFLQDDFRQHPVYNFFKSINTKLALSVLDTAWKEDALGNGWAWNDFSESYAAERSAFPIYGNVIRISTLPLKERALKEESLNRVFLTTPSYFDSLINDAFTYNSYQVWQEPLRVELLREINRNSFYINVTKKTTPKNFTIPFSTKDFTYQNQSKNLSIDLLIDTLHSKNSGLIPWTHRDWNNHIWRYERFALDLKNISWQPIYSQPTDSLLKPMMHRSDNFFAEQTLLMVSNEMTGVMNDAKIIDSLLKTDLKDLPQKPRWVDGSGLSRYNLFSPNDMVHVLNKMKNEFDWNRITTILPTGGEGTLSNYYINLKDKIFAKTGTLSNNIALSGFLITKQNKTLIFSILVNNHMGNTTQIRKAVEKFLTEVAEKH